MINWPIKINRNIVFLVTIALSGDEKTFCLEYIIFHWRLASESEYKEQCVEG